MLRIGQPIEIKATLSVDGEPHELTFLVRPPDRSFLEAAREITAETSAAFFTPDRVAGLLLGWTGLADADGQPLPCTAEALDQVRECAPTVYSTVVDALWRSVPHKQERDRKN